MARYKVELTITVNREPCKTTVVAELRKGKWHCRYSMAGLSPYGGGDFLIEGSFSADEVAKKIKKQLLAAGYRTVFYSTDGVKLEHMGAK